MYPSLQFGWDIPQFQTVVKEYLKTDEDDVEEETEQIYVEEEKES